MSIYTSLDPDTQVLIDMWIAHETQQGWAFTSERQVQLEAARETALEAIRDDFVRQTWRRVHASMES